MEKVIGQAIWNGIKLWPVLPHFPQTAALAWPAPKGIAAKKLFRTFILKNDVAEISSPSAMIVSGKNTRRSWGIPARNEFFTNWIAAHEVHPWGLKDLVVGLNKIKKWWDSEWSDIEHDVEFVDELREAIVVRFNLIDEILDKSTDMPCGNGKPWFATPKTAS
ncbi:MAG: hypothetical protein V4646_14830 [Pseudomonadota bacterium]